MKDRVAGGIILFLSIFYGLTAFRFKLEYLVEPLGPSKYPILLSLFSIILSLYLIIFPGKLDIIKWKLTAIDRRIPIFIVSLFLYIFLLWISGYIIATFIYITFLGLIFGSTFFKSAIMAMVFSIAIYLFFVSLLKLHLPTSYIIDMLK
jgi:putative tricarboxylic transport membrane protein